MGGSPRPDRKPRRHLRAVRGAYSRQAPENRPPTTSTFNAPSITKSPTPKFYSTSVMPPCNRPPSPPTPVYAARLLLHVPPSGKSRHSSAAIAAAMTTSPKQRPSPSSTGPSPTLIAVNLIKKKSKKKLPCASTFFSPFARRPARRHPQLLQHCSICLRPRRTPRLDCRQRRLLVVLPAVWDATLRRARRTGNGTLDTAFADILKALSNHTNLAKMAQTPPAPKKIKEERPVILATAHEQVPMHEDADVSNTI